MLPSDLWMTCPSPPPPPPPPSLPSLRSIRRLIPHVPIFSTSRHRTSPHPSHAISPSTTTPPSSRPISYLQNLKTVRFRISLNVSFHIHRTRFKIPQPFKSPPPPTPFPWTPPPPIPFPCNIPIPEDPPPKYDLVKSIGPRESSVRQSLNLLYNALHAHYASGTDTPLPESTAGDSEEEESNDEFNWHTTFPTPPHTPPQGDQTHPPAQWFCGEHPGQDWELNDALSTRYYPATIPDPTTNRLVVAPFVCYVKAQRGKRWSVAEYRPVSKNCILCSSRYLPEYRPVSKNWSAQACKIHYLYI